MKHYISIDIGGTAIKYGIIDEHGNILLDRETATEAWKGGPAILEKAVHIVETFMDEWELKGICISTAGMVDTEKGFVFYSAPLIPDYAGTEFKRVMEERFGIPCEVENDVNCAGLAESISGVARDSKVTLCLTVGTGIGGCIVIDGQVYHGYSNSACEVGYMHMFGGDFQTLGAASILSSKVAEKKGERGEEWSGRRIFKEAKRNDAVCCQAIEEMADVLGLGIANICYVLNPQTVVLGGGIMAQKEYLYPLIRRAMDRYLVQSIADKTTLRMAEHKNHAGMLGAFYHFQNCHDGNRRH